MWGAWGSILAWHQLQADYKLQVLFIYCDNCISGWYESFRFKLINFFFVFVLFLEVTLSLGVVWGQCNIMSCPWLNLCAGVQQTGWLPVVLISQNAPQSSQPSFCRSSLPRISPAGREWRKWCDCLFIDVHFISNPSISLCLYRKWPCSAATAKSKFKYAESHKQMLVMLFSLFQLSFCGFIMDLWTINKWHMALVWSELWNEIQLNCLSYVHFWLLWQNHF